MALLQGVQKQAGSFGGAVLLALFAAANLFAADWKIKDGTGSSFLKDSGPDKIDLKITTPETVTWAREDDRDFFLNFSGGEVTGPAEKLLFPDGMILEIFFSPDLSKGGEWLPLVTCGNTFTSGYSVWVRKNGQVLIFLPGVKNAYNLIDAKLENLRDYTLKFVRTSGRGEVCLNGKLISRFPSTGKMKHTPGEPFRLGSTPKWKYYGNIYSLRIEKYSEGALNPKEKKLDYPASEIRPVPGVTDPEGTVIVSDFTQFSPKPLAGTCLRSWTWGCRRADFFPGYKYVLMSSGDPDDAVISLSPKLEGAYDVYLGLRANTLPVDFKLSVPDGRTRYRVRIGAASPKFHPNTEVLIAKNVKMDGGKIAFYPGGWMFLGYIKFIPSSNPRKVDYPKWNCVSVTKEDPDYRKIAEAKARALIARGYYKERIHADEKPHPSPGPVSRKWGYILNRQDWMDLCFSNSIPAAAPESVALACAAAPGEFEPVCFAVHGLEDCGQLTLTGTDALEKKGISVSAAVVGEIPKRTTNLKGPSEFIRGPQFLERTNTALLGKGKTRQFWLTVKVGESVPPGNYSCDLTLSSNRGKRIIPLTVTVRPFKLDPIVRERIAVIPTLPGDFQIYPGLVREMAEHGCNTFWMQMETDIVTRPDGSIDWARSPLVGHIVELKRHGASALVFETEHTSGKFFRKKDGSRRYQRAIREILTRAAKENWPQVFFYTHDEVLSHAKHLPKVRWETPLLKACGAKVLSSHLWYRTSRPYEKEVKELAPQTDVFMLRFNTRNFWYVDPWSDIMARCRRENRELWAYNSDNAVLFAQPAMKRFAWGWFFRTLGRNATGHVFIAYASSVGSPYTELDGRTDWCYNLPANTVRKGGFIIDYEAFREGADDLRYIITLENRIAAAKKQGFSKEAAEAEQVLTKLAESFDFGKNFAKNSVFLDSVFERNWERDGVRFCSGRRNLPNGWRFEDYHAAREKIAEEIVKLDRLLPRN